jgi:hypothetical protein
MRTEKRFYWIISNRDETAFICKMRDGITTNCWQTLDIESAAKYENNLEAHRVIEYLPIDLFPDKATYKLISIRITFEKVERNV